jgi:hypothetical protein
VKRVKDISEEYISKAHQDAEAKKNASPVIVLEGTPPIQDPGGTTNAETPGGENIVLDGDGYSKSSSPYVQPKQGNGSETISRRQLENLNWVRRVGLTNEEAVRFSQAVKETAEDRPDTGLADLYA